MRRLFNFVRATAVWLLLLAPTTYFVGAASNQLVLIANHGKFPVMRTESAGNASRLYYARHLLEQGADPVIVEMAFQEGMTDSVHCVMTSETHLNFLADNFRLGNSIWSLGDFLLVLSEWLATFCPFIWIFEMIRSRC